MSSFFKILDLVLSQYAPCSYHLDHDPVLLKEAYQALVAMGALGLLIPKCCGGYGGEREDWAKYNIEMAGCSGALLFLQAQHQFAMNQLKQYSSDANVRALLKRLLQQQEGVGYISAAAARNLTVLRHQEGLSLTGTIPWVTGWGFFSQAYITLEFQGVEYHALIPFYTTAGLICTSVIATSMFQSAQTVSLVLEDFLLKDTAVLYQCPHVVRAPMEHPAIYNFAGIAKACLKEAKQGKYHKGEQALAKSQQLQNAWQFYYDTIMAGVSLQPLALRAQGLRLAEACASFARLMCGAASVLETHPVGRLSKDLWQNAVAGIAETQIDAYLKEEGIVED